MNEYKNLIDFMHNDSGSSFVKDGLMHKLLQVFASRFDKSDCVAQEVMDNIKTNTMNAGHKRYNVSIPYALDEQGRFWMSVLQHFKGTLWFQYSRSNQDVSLHIRLPIHCVVDTIWSSEQNQDDVIGNIHLLQKIKSANQHLNAQISFILPHYESVELNENAPYITLDFRLDLTKKELSWNGVCVNLGNLRLSGSHFIDIREPMWLVDVVKELHTEEVLLKIIEPNEQLAIWEQLLNLPNSRKDFLVLNQYAKANSICVYANELANLFTPSVQTDDKVPVQPFIGLPTEEWRDALLTMLHNDENTNMVVRVTVTPNNEKRDDIAIEFLLSDLLQNKAFENSHSAFTSYIYDWENKSQNAWDGVDTHTKKRVIELHGLASGRGGRRPRSIYIPRINSRDKLSTTIGADEILDTCSFEEQLYVIDRALSQLNLAIQNSSTPINTLNDLWSLAKSIGFSEYVLENWITYMFVNKKADRQFILSMQRIKNDWNEWNKQKLQQIEIVESTSDEDFSHASRIIRLFLN